MTAGEKKQAMRYGLPEHGRKCQSCIDKERRGESLYCLRGNFYVKKRAGCSI